MFIFFNSVIWVYPRSEWNTYIVYHCLCLELPSQNLKFIDLEELVLMCKLGEGQNSTAMELIADEALSEI